MSTDFLQADNIDGYTMRAHLSDQDPHPQYLRNTAEDIATAISNYLQDHPMDVQGALESLTDVVITDPTAGQVLVFDAVNRIWKNQSIESVGIQDIKVDGVSVVIDNVAYIPAASATSYGVTRLATKTEAMQGYADNVGVTPADVNTVLLNFKENMPGSMVVHCLGSASGHKTWSIVGTDGFYQSGEVVSNLIPGTYTVEFYCNDDSVEVPEQQTVKVFGGSLANIVGVYEDTRSTVTIMYDNADITWNISGSNVSHGGGYTASVNNLQALVVKFNNTGELFNTPDDIKIAVEKGSNLMFDISDLIKPASGVLTVSLFGEGSGSISGAKWYIQYADGSLSEEKRSGESIELLKSEEPYILKFTPVEGYVTPGDQVIYISSKDTKLTYNGRYLAYGAPIYGVRVVRGGSETELDGVIYDRTGVSEPTIISNADSWLSDNRMLGGLTAHDFRKCLIKDGKVNYYLDPTDSTKKFNGTYRGVTSDGSGAVLTGEDGDVMVEILPVYYRIVPVGMTSDGYPIEDWIVSRDEFPGSVLHPYFRVGRSAHTDNGTYVQYLGAYESVLCYAGGDPIPTFGIETPNSFVDEALTCRSIKGYKPVTNMSVANFRSAHKNAGLHTMNVLAMEFLALMMFIEYRSFNSQDSGTVNYDTGRGCMGDRSSGFSWYNQSFQYKFVRNTGRADNFGNGTGEVTWSDAIDYSDGSTSLPDNFNQDAPGSKKVVGFTYRGIENPFGHISKFVDGILTYANGYYLTDMPDKYTSSSNDVTVAGAGYTNYLHTWPIATTGFIQTFEFSQSKPSFLPLVVGSEANACIPDYYLDSQVGALSYGGRLGQFGDQLLCRNQAGISTVVKQTLTNASMGSRSAFSMIVG